MGLQSYLDQMFLMSRPGDVRREAEMRLKYIKENLVFLICDDDPLALDALAELISALSPHEVRLATATNGKEAKGYLNNPSTARLYSSLDLNTPTIYCAATGIDVVVTDLEMPYENGDEVLYHALGLGFSPELLWLASGTTTDPVKDFVQETGVHHIKKPYGIEEIRELISQTDRYVESAFRERLKLELEEAKARE